MASALTGLIRDSEIWLTLVVATVGLAAVCFFLWRRRRNRLPVLLDGDCPRPRSWRRKLNRPRTQVPDRIAPRLTPADARQCARHPGRCDDHGTHRHMLDTHRVNRGRRHVRSGRRLAPGPRQPGHRWAGCTGSISHGPGRIVGTSSLSVPENVCAVVRPTRRSARSADAGDQWRRVRHAIRRQLARRTDPRCAGQRQSAHSTVQLDRGRSTCSNLTNAPTSRSSYRSRPGAKNTLAGRRVLAVVSRRAGRGPRTPGAAVRAVAPLLAVGRDRRRRGDRPAPTSPPHQRGRRPTASNGPLGRGTGQRKICRARERRARAVSLGPDRGPLFCRVSTAGNSMRSNCGGFARSSTG